jgi:hypothetical protein
LFKRKAEQYFVLIDCTANNSTAVTYIADERKGAVVPLQKGNFCVVVRGGKISYSSAEALHFVDSLSSDVGIVSRDR